MSQLKPADAVSTPSQPWYRGLGRGDWWVFSVGSLAWLFDCLDQQLFNLARDGAMESLVADKARLAEFGSYTTSCFLVGWALGGLALGALGDRFGRARVLAVCVLLYSLCTGLSAFATTYAQFCAYRLITGFGVGGVFGLAVALIADSLPDRSRPGALGMLQSLSTLGNVLAGLCGIAVSVWAAKGPLPMELKTWQVLFLIGALPAFLSVAVIGRLPEPKKWVDARARGAKTGVRFGSYTVLLKDPRWRKNAWLALGLCCAGIIGLWGIGNFHPTIVRGVVAQHLAAENLSAAELATAKSRWSSLALLLQNVGGFCGMLALAKLAQVKGRRFALASGLVASFGTTVLVFWGLRDVGQIYWMLPLMGAGQLSVFAGYAIYLPELFPTSLRSTGTSFCYNVGRLLAATAPFTLGRITKTLGGDLESFRWAGLCVSGVLLLGLLTLPFLPETKDKPLPED